LTSSLLFARPCSSFKLLQTGRLMSREEIRGEHKQAVSSTAQHITSFWCHTHAHRRGRQQAHSTRGASKALYCTLNTALTTRPMLSSHLPQSSLQAGMRVACEACQYRTATRKRRQENTHLTSAPCSATAASAAARLSAEGGAPPAAAAPGTTPSPPCTASIVVRRSDRPYLDAHRSTNTTCAARDWHTQKMLHAPPPLPTPEHRSHTVPATGGTNNSPHTL
jgi:hypothetical protein